MGIHDRDYVRNHVQPRGPFAPGGALDARGWSANTWVIVLCIAVFIIDGFLPPKHVEMGRVWNPDITHVDPASLVQRLPAAPEQLDRLSAGEGYRVLLVHRETGEIVGADYYRVMHPLAAALHFSTVRGFLGIEFWRFIGFQFLHVNIFHLLFNMVGLFFFGPMVERYLGSKRYLAFYLLCGIFGALMYLILNLAGFAVSLYSPNVHIPGLLFSDTHTPLIGASAGVFGVLMAGAALAPRATVLLYFVIPLQLRTLAYALVAIAFFSVLFGVSNAGGEAAHLGGAIAGFYFIRRPHHLHGFFDIIGRADPTSHHYRKGGRSTHPRAPGRRQPTNQEIDRILQKVSERGLQSLTEAEKQMLRSASDERP